MYIDVLNHAYRRHIRARCKWSLARIQFIKIKLNYVPTKLLTLYLSLLSSIFRAKAVIAAQGKAGKKKKWSKGKVKDKANNAVICDKVTFDRIMKEVPTFKMISQSVLIDRMKINGSLARTAIRHLLKEGLIKPVIHHRAQLVYTRTTTEEALE